MEKHEWKKEEKAFYLPGNEPEVVKIPSMNYFVLEGQGNPNDPFFAEYIEALYAASYGLRMSYKNNCAPEGYYEYTVYPLEGVWDLTEAGKTMQLKTLEKQASESTVVTKTVAHLKDELLFKIMIRQPDFVTQAWCLQNLPALAQKKKNPLIEQIKLVKMEDGLCVQMLHVGSYDDEPESFEKMANYCNHKQLKRLEETHREIYISDARKTAPEKLKTVLRIRVEAEN